MAGGLRWFRGGLKIALIIVSICRFYDGSGVNNLTFNLWLW